MNPRSHSTSDVEPKGITEGMATSRAEAFAVGGTKYYTGKPCSTGHVTYRYTASGACAGCYSLRAKRRWAEGVRQTYADRRAVNGKWNASEKAQTAKERWRQKDPKKAWAVYATGGAKARASARKLPFDLTSAYVLEITPDTCPIYGTPFSFVGNKTVAPESATLDRLDPVKGYVQSNVAVISMKANAIKNAYGSEDIQKVADWLRGVGL